MWEIFSPSGNFFYNNLDLEPHVNAVSKLTLLNLSNNICLSIAVRKLNLRFNMSEVEAVTVSKIEVEQSLLRAESITRARLPLSPHSFSWRLLQKGSCLPDLLLPAVVCWAVHGVPDQGGGRGGGGDAGGEVGGEADLPPLSPTFLSQLHWALTILSPGRWYDYDERILKCGGNILMMKCMLYKPPTKSRIKGWLFTFAQGRVVQAQAQWLGWCRPSKPGQTWSLELPLHCPGRSRTGRTWPIVCQSVINILKISQFSPRINIVKKTTRRHSLHLCRVCGELAHWGCWTNCLFAPHLRYWWLIGVFANIALAKIINVELHLAGAGGDGGPACLPPPPPPLPRAPHLAPLAPPPPLPPCHLPPSVLPSVDFVNAGKVCNGALAPLLTNWKCSSGPTPSRWTLSQSLRPESVYLQIWYSVSGFF